MFPAISRRLDRIAIATACRSVRGAGGGHDPLEHSHPDYFAAPDQEAVFEFQEKGRFCFPSPVPSPEEKNNTVWGQFVPAKSSREQGRKPAVLLIHGWNGEQGYRFLFPLLARRFARLGLTTVMIELPYHGSRKPRRGALRNFLSGDVIHMTEATRQAIADIRAAVGWLEAQGYGPVGLWGVSLGAWLGGLVACVDDRVKAAVLVTPVPRIDQAIENLAFCRHIRASLEGCAISPASLNLTAHRPKPAPEDLLIVESVYDLFAPAESVEELWRTWKKPDIWRVKHGHISVLLSIPIMNRTGHWLGRRLRGERS